MPTFSNSAEDAVRMSLDIASSHRQELVTPEHFLLALTFEDGVANLLVTLKIDPLKLRLSLEDFIENELPSVTKEQFSSKPVPDQTYQRIVQRAAINVQSRNLNVVRGINFFAAFFAEKECHALHLLEQHGAIRYKVVEYITGEAREDHKGALDNFSIKFFDTTTEDGETVEKYEEERKVVYQLKNSSPSIALLARSIELQILDEVERKKSAKPNFETNEEVAAFERELEFLEALAHSLGKLAEQIANLDSDDSDGAMRAVAENTLALRDKVFNYLADNKKDAVFYGIKMPAMLGSIALFSLAGAHMVTATPILMGIFGGDKIVKLLKNNDK